MNPLARDLIILLILSCAGAAGGYLAAIQRRVESPKSSTVFHMLQGAAGAIIIVTLSPVDPRILGAPFVTEEPLSVASVSTQQDRAQQALDRANEQQLFIKLIALALIGGYAGSSLLESSASQYARIKQIEERQDKVEETAQKGLDAVHKAEEILRGLKVSPSDLKDFRVAVLDASPTSLFEIAYRADEVRKQHWQDDKEQLGRSLVIFETLVETKDAESSHWWYASLGYCLKDKLNPDYEAAVKRLDTAIKLRGSVGRSGAYEFNRAFCYIRLLEEQPNSPLGSRWKEQIREDLDIAGKFPRFRDIIEKEEAVQKWMRGDPGIPARVS